MGEERPHDRQRAGARIERRRRSRKSSPGSRARTSASAVNVVSSETNSCAWVSAAGATSAALAAERLNEPREARVLGGEVAHHRLEVLEHAGQPAQRLVQRRAAAREGVAELDQVLLRSPRWWGRRRCSAPRRSRPARGSPGRSGSSPPRRSPRRSCPCTISRYLSPSAERERTTKVESTGSGSMSRSSLRSRRAADVAVLVLLGFDRLDRPHPHAADPHLVGRHEQLGVGDLRREPVGGHEGQPAVGVVGQKDREDHDHHCEGADHRRARRERAGRRASSLALPGVPADRRRGSRATCEPRPPGPRAGRAGPAPRGPRRARWAPPRCRARRARAAARGRPRGSPRGRPRACWARRSRGCGRGSARRRRGGARRAAAPWRPGRSRLRPTNFAEQPDWGIEV